MGSGQCAGQSGHPRRAWFRTWVARETGWGRATWDDLITIHVSTLWQCDFLCKRSLTPKEFRDPFAIVVLHVGSKRVYISPATAHPNEVWVNKQAADFLKHVKMYKLPAEYLMHDRDMKFTTSFDKALREGGLKIKEAAYQTSPPRRPGALSAARTPNETVWSFRFFGYLPVWRDRTIPT